MLETDEFFLKFLEPFKKLKASDEVAAWEKAGALAFEVRRCLSGPNPSTDLTGSRVLRAAHVRASSSLTLPPTHPHTHTHQTKTGVRPTLHLFAPGATEPAETVSVASWTTESMLEFLQDSIPAASTAAAKGGEKTKKDGSKAAQHEEL